MARILELVQELRSMTVFIAWLLVSMFGAFMLAAGLLSGQATVYVPALALTVLSTWRLEQC